MTHRHMFNNYTYFLVRINLCIRVIQYEITHSIIGNAATKYKIRF